VKFQVTKPEETNVSFPSMMFHQTKDFLKQLFNQDSNDTTHGIHLRKVSLYGQKYNLNVSRYGAQPCVLAVARCRSL